MTRMWWSRQKTAASPDMSTLLHGVIDSGSGTLLAIGAFPATLVLLSESMLDTIYVPAMQIDDVQKLRTASPHSYPEWSWSSGNAFKKTNPAIITEELRARAVFAAKKKDTLARAIYSVNRMRDKIDTGLTAQAMIYLQKAEQARALKDANYDITTVHAPYVVQHAEDVGIPLAAAADDILFQAQLDNEHLEKTERVRIALFRKLKRATTAEELDSIMRTYYRDGMV